VTIIKRAYQGETDKLRMAALVHSAPSEHAHTDNYRPAAIALYEGIGFRTSQKVLVYRKEYLRGNS